jgi:hypothetical protein
MGTAWVLDLDHPSGAFLKKHSPTVALAEIRI